MSGKKMYSNELKLEPFVRQKYMSNERGYFYVWQEDV